MRFIELRFFLVAAIAAASMLAGCGGGSGSSGSGPVPVPTQSPTVYSAKIIALGGDNPSSYGSLQYFLRHPMSVTSSPLPVTLTTTDSNNPNFAFSGGGDTTAIVTMQVAPSPAASPTTSWSTNAGIALQTPSPGMSPAPTGVSVTTPNQTDSGHSVSATVSTPVNTVTTIPVFVYPRFIVAFPSIDQSSAINASEWTQALSFGTGTLHVETDPANADIYGDGPNVCCGSFHNPGETAATLHYPCGGVWFHDSQGAFATLTASQWVNAGTSVTVDSLTTPLTDPQTLLLFKTRPCGTGKVVKLFFRQISANDKDSGPYQVSGSAIDGF